MIEMIDDYAKMISGYAISLFYNNIIMLLFVPILQVRIQIEDGKIAHQSHKATKGQREDFYLSNKISN